MTRALKSKQDADKIASELGLKPSTVKAIRQAKSWPEYERRKAVKAAAIKRYKAKSQPVTRKKVVPGRTVTRDQFTSFGVEVMVDISKLTVRVAALEKWVKARQDMELAETLERRPRRFSLWRAR